MALFSLTQGDTLPALTASLTDANGAINLTGATVQLRIRAIDGTTVLTKSATIDSPATAGKVRYAWVAGDTDAPGTFFAEWRVIYTAGVLTVPNESPILIRTRVRLDDLAQISAADLLAIRDRIGEGPTDSELAALMTKLGTVDKVVLSVMEQRFDAALAKPAKYTIEGDSSFDYSKNLELMAKQLKDQRDTTTGGMTTGQLLARWDR